MPSKVSFNTVMSCLIVLNSITNQTLALLAQVLQSKCVVGSSRKVQVSTVEPLSPCFFLPYLSISTYHKS